MKFLSRRCRRRNSGLVVEKREAQGGFDPNAALSASADPCAIS